MAQNVFTTDPLKEVLTADTRPAQQVDPITQFEDLARETRVPVNVLMAAAERDQSADIGQVRTTATQWAQQMQQGQSIEDILADTMPDSDVFLNRARELGGMIYGGETTTATPTEEGSNLGKTIRAGLARTTGGIAQGVGLFADSLVNVVRQGELRPTFTLDFDEEGNAVVNREESDAVPTTMFTEAMDEWVADPLRGVAEGIEQTRDQDLQDEIAASGFGDSNLFDPSTWEVSEDATLRGFFHKGVQITAELLPVIATAILTRSPAATMSVGGAQAGGAAADEAENTVRAAAEDVDENGVSRLERESEIYRDLIAGGMSPEDATEKLVAEATLYAGQVAAAIGGVGGVATQRIIAPAGNRLVQGSLMTRVLGTAGLSGLEEGVQEVAEGVAQRAVTADQTGLDIDPLAGTLEEGVMGAVAGGPIGGLTAIPNQRRDEEQVDGQSAAEPLAIENQPAPALPSPNSQGMEPPLAANPAYSSDTAPQPSDAPDTRGRMTRILDETAPSVTPIPTNTAVTITAPDGTTIEGEMVAEQADSVVVATNTGERVDVPRDDIASGAVRVEPSALAQSATATEPPRVMDTPIEDMPAPEARRVLTARLEQIEANRRRQGMTPAAQQLRDTTVQQLSMLPPPPPPVGLVEDVSAADGTVTGREVTLNGPWDFDNTFPAPDPNAYAQAAALGVPVPSDPAGVVDALMPLVEQATEALAEANEQRAAGNTAKANRAMKAYKGMMETAGVIWPDNAVEQLSQKVVQFAKGLTDLTAKQKAEAETPAPTAATPSDDDIAAATQAALDAAIADEAASDATTAPDAPATQPMDSSPWDTMDSAARETLLRRAGQTTSTGKLRAPALKSLDKPFAELGKAVKNAVTRMLADPDTTTPTETTADATPEMTERAPDADTLPMLEAAGFVQSKQSKREGTMSFGRNTENKNMPGEVTRAAIYQSQSGWTLQGQTGAVIASGYDLAKVIAEADRLEPAFTPDPTPEPDTSQTTDTDVEADGQAQAAADAAAADPESNVTVDNKPDPNPTEGQKEAGNYQKAHIKFQGLDITIENAKGTERSGTDPNGETWSVTMPADYGYIKRTEGADGDHVDVYVGTAADADLVVVVDQVDLKSKAFDEHKVMLGFKNSPAAVAAYVRGFSDGKGMERRGDITKLTMAEFKDWLANGDTTKPMSSDPKAGGTQEAPDDSAPPAPDVKEDNAATDTNNTPNTQTRKPAPRSKGPKIEDFGEKIGGARKDKAQRMRDAMSDDIDPDTATMATAFPIPDYPALQATGLDARALAVVALSRNSVPRKPTRYQARWKRRLLMAREVSATAMEGKFTDEMYDVFGADSGMKVDFKVMQEIPADMLHEASTTYTATEKYNDPDTLQVRPSRKGGYRQAVDVKGPQAAAAHIIEQITATREASKDKPKRTRKPVELQIESANRGEGPFYVGYKVSGFVRLTQPFETRAEATAYLGINRETLLEQAEGMRDGMVERKPENRVRSGPEYRSKDVTPEAFSKAFGFRGVEFGNWTNNTQRQRSLNDAYDALTDLSGALGIPTQAVGLDGTLGLAFGARGTGGRAPAAAHYEPDLRVINLTKNHGPGSLAHEWLHAVDHYLAIRDADEGGPSIGRLDIGDDTRAFMSARAKRTMQSTSTPVANAFARVREQMKNGNAWHRRSVDADNSRSKAYYSTTIEMAARSFEKYVVDRLTERGMSSDYLANVNMLGGAYPTTREMNTSEVRTAWDSAISAMVEEITQNVKGKPPALPAIDTSRLYDGPDVGEVWETLDGKAKVEERDGDTFNVLMPDGSTEVFTASELDTRMTADRKAVADMINAGRAKRQAKEDAKKQAVAEAEDEADAAMEAFAKSSDQSLSRVRSALLESVYLRNQPRTSRAAMIMRFANDGWRVGKGYKTKEAFKSPDGTFYDRKVWGNVGMAFAKWYGDIADATATADARAQEADSTPSQSEIENATKKALDDAVAAEKSAGEAARDAVGNVADAGNAAIAGLVELFGGKNTLNSGLTFSKETYAKAQPLFDQALRSLGAAGSNINEMAQALVRTLVKAGMDADGRSAMSPYLNRYIGEVVKGEHDPFTDSQAAPEPQAAPNPMAPVTKAVLQHLRDGGMFTNIKQARKMAADALGRKVTTQDHKGIEEAVEEAVVTLAREAAASTSKPETVYNRLVDLYASQPILAERTSTSVALQAYSTPAPLAYLASQLAGVTADTVVFDPAAGLGMLTQAVPDANIIANELDAARAQALSRLAPAAEVTVADATELTVPNYDVMITNPPFATVKDANGRNKSWPLGGTTTTEIDQAIAWRALGNMPEDGSAVLLLGGVKETLTGADRVKGYRAGAKSRFYKHLYDTYNVVEHFTVSGRLYAKQGAQWPVDVVVVRGKGQSNNVLPMKEAPPVYTSWADLKEKLDVADSLGATEHTVERSPVGRNGGADTNALATAADGTTGDVNSDSRPSGNADTGPADSPTTDGATDGRDQRGVVDGNLGTDGSGRPAGTEPAGVSSDVDGQGSQSGRDGTGRTDADGLDQSLDASPVDRVNTEKETTYQVQYTPRSAARYAVGTLVPNNMRDAVNKALDQIEAEKGNIDDYVADALGYSRDELLGTGKTPGRFSAEQVDAAAMAIYNVQQGKGFIVGDQTGVGKGRLVAAMLRYAEKAGLTPVFVTKDKGLYSDMIRDLRDIGEEAPEKGVFVTDTTLRGKNALPLSDDPTDRLEGATVADNKAGIDHMAKTGTLPEGARFLFTTYSQTQAIGKVEPERRAALRAIAPNAMFVLDESHEAGGGAQSAFADPDAPANRADFMREILAKAKGTVFSSATYAKNPQVMTLYATTDLSMAVKDASKLSEAIEAGGVPLQQVVANMLVESAQYARRERSFAGVDMTMEAFEVDVEQATVVTARIADIFDADLQIMSQVRKDAINKMVEDGYTQTMDGAVGVQSGDSANFASVLHNVTSQLLLALKVKPVAEAAIEAHKRGEKPLLALFNTNGALLDQIVEDQLIKVGDPVETPFSAILHRYVDRLRNITLKDADKKAVRITLTDAQMPAAAVATLRGLHEAIDKTDFGDLSSSPLDQLRELLTDAGMNVGEITGRGRIVEDGKLQVRDASSAAKKAQMFAFNKGKLDAVIVNQSGSTGYSLHALDDPSNDGKVRHMIVMQPDPNIDVFMQMLGRIHRTGQSQLPRYTIAASDLAIEKRVSAILMRKMASLNANTTASKKSAVSLDNVTDFLNVVGDTVVNAYLAENSSLAVRLDVSIAEGTPTGSIAQKVTGRLAIMPPEETAEIFDAIETAYNDELAQLEKMGENPLEAQVYDWQAEQLSSAEIEAANDATSPFSQPTVVETLSVRRLGRPYTLDQLQERIGDILNGETANEHMERAATQFKDAVAAQSDIMDAAIELAKDADTKARAGDNGTKAAKAKDALAKARDRLASATNANTAVLAKLREFMPGTAVRITTPSASMIGTVMEIDASALTINPSALSKIRVRFAVADAIREIVVPMNKIMSEGGFQIEGIYHKLADAAFKAGRSGSRETRQVVTGNLINAFAKFGKGQVAFFTDSDGRTRTGVVLPKGFDAAKALADEPVVFNERRQMMDFLNAGSRTIHTSDRLLEITTTTEGNYQLEASNKAKGYYASTDIAAVTGDWTGRGRAPKKVTVYDADTLGKLLDIYDNVMKPTYEARGNKDVARLLTGQTLPEIEALPDAKQRRRSGPATGADRTSMRKELQDRLRRAGLAPKISLAFARNITTREGMKLDGYQLGRTIALAMDAADPRATLDHEIIHALRSSEIWGNRTGLFNDAEWHSLVRAARADQRRMAKLKQLYPELTTRELNEEAVAEMYAEYGAGRHNPTTSGVFAKIGRILSQLRNLLLGAGYSDAAEIMADIAEGGIARRMGDPEPDPDGTPLVSPDSARSRRRDPEGSKTSADRITRTVNAAIDASMDVVNRARDAVSTRSLRAAVSNAMDQGESGTSILGLVPGRPLLKELGKHLPSAAVYQRTKEAMDATRNRWAAETDSVAKKWQGLAARDRDSNAAFMDLMHEATIAGIDPMGPELDPERLNSIAETNANGVAAKAALERAKVRGQQADLRTRFNALPEGFQKLWGEIRDSYRDLADEFDKAILENHKKIVARQVRKLEEQAQQDRADIDLGTLSQGQKAKARAKVDAELAKATKAAEKQGRARIASLRAAFESNRVEKPYFPLARFGNYTVTLKDEAGQVVSFSRFKGEKAQMDFAAEWDGKYEVITSVLNRADTRLDKSVDAEFVADMIQILGDEGVNGDILDTVWQRYLETMPDMSLRTSRIHRKGREGYTSDALKSFASHMFHGAHQLARLAHTEDMSEALDNMVKETRSAPDPNRAQHVVNEIQRRHEFTMSPTNAGWTAAASSLAFIWYLAMAPAAAMVNLSQTTVVGIPVMRAKFAKSSVDEVAAELGRASKDFAKGFDAKDWREGFATAQRSKDITRDEWSALQEANDRAIIDKTQAHDVAGLAETGIEYSPVRARIMEVLGYSFHHAERANREVTFLTGYRLARKEGLNHQAAIDKAADVTWDVHFDYQNNSRPRFMQDDWPKALLVFRNFNVNMLYRLFRDTHQAIKADTPEAQREARLQLLGISGSLFLHAGIKGVWGYGIIMTIAGLFFPQGGSDEAEDALKRLLVGAEDPETNLGQVRQFLGKIVLDGAPGATLGVDLSERIGMPNLWFRAPFRDMEGTELYTHYMTQMLGPVPSVFERWVRGGSQVLSGEWYRGIETAAPKFVRDGMRAGRYYVNGVTTYGNNDPVVEDINLYQALQQAIGFTPAEISERYETNSHMKNMEARIEDRRRGVLADIRRDVRQTGSISQATMDALYAYNADIPEWAITSDTIRRSLRAAATASQQNTGGIRLNSQIEARVRDNTTRTIYD